MKRAASARRKALAVLLGSCVTLALAELGLYVVGWTPSRAGAGFRASASSYLIDCFGNSYTAGVGAPAGKTYCDDLGARLAADPAFHGVEVRTRNFGKKYMNSSQVLEAIPVRVNEERPNLVLIMTGEPNISNRTGYGAYLARVHGAQSIGLWKRVGLAAYGVLSHSRVFRFAEIVASGAIIPSEGNDADRSVFFRDTRLNEREILEYRWLQLFVIDPEIPGQLSDPQAKEALSYLTELERKPEGRDVEVLPVLIGRLYVSHFGDSASAVRWYGKALEESKDRFNADAFFDLRNLAAKQPGVYGQLFAASKRNYPGDAFMKKMPDIGHLTYAGFDRMSDQEVRDDLRFFEKVRRYRPEYENVFAHIARDSMRLQQWDEACSALEWIIRRNPLGPSGWYFLTLSQQLREKQPALAPRIDAFLAEFRARFPAESGQLQWVSDAELKAWIRSDLVEMGNYLRARGIPFIFQAYPPRRDRTLRPADEVTPGVADETGFPFSDTLHFLEESFAKSGKREAFYSNDLGPLDNHLNADGYDLIAQLLVRDIKRYGFVPGRAFPWH